MTVVVQSSQKQTLHDNGLLYKLCRLLLMFCEGLPGNLPMAFVSFMGFSWMLPLPQ